MSNVDQVDDGRDSGWFFTELPENKYFFESEQNKSIIAIDTNERISSEQIRELTKKDLKERVNEVFQKEAFAEYRVDNQLVIRVPSTKLCDESVKVWEKYAEACSKKTNRFGVGFSVLSVTGIGLFASGAAAPWVALALGIGGVISGIFALMNYETKSKREIEDWKNPHQNRIADQRKKAYENGFLYVFKEGLKFQGQGPSSKAFLLEEEVRFLYGEYFDKYCKDRLMSKPSDNVSKTVWVEQFKRDNPVSEKMMVYGWGEIPENFKGIGKDYEQLVKILSGNPAFFNRQKTRVYEEAAAHIEKINQKREESLTPYRTNRDNQYSVAFALRAEQMKKAQTKEEEEKIHTNYAQSTQKYYNFYNQIAAEISKPFDKKIKEIKEELNKTIAKIDEQQKALQLTYFKDAWAMMESIQNLKSNPSFVYTCPISILNKQNFESSFPAMDDIPKDFDHVLRQAYVNDPDFLALLNQEPATYTPFVLRRDSEGYYLLPHFEKGGFKNLGTWKLKDSRIQIGDFIIDTTRRILPEGWIFADEDNRTTGVSSDFTPLSGDTQA